MTAIPGTAGQAEIDCDVAGAVPAALQAFGKHQVIELGGIKS